ncbi:MAG: DUF4412 domain-containing protein [Pseudomonadota bacterium]
MMKLKFLAVLVLLLPAMVAVAADRNVEFSADIVRSIPQQGDQHGKLYIGAGRMRMEFEANGDQLIQIMDSHRQTAYMINATEKSYMLQSAGPGDMMTGAERADDTNPCAGMKNISCKRTGEEMINGRLAEKWEFSSTAQPESGKMITWLDKQRRFPVRQSMPDGSATEMIMTGTEKINGRKTEKWEMKSTRPGGESQVSYQWYDPELNMNIREKHAGGYTRELRNIRIGKQPAELFTVPAGYKEITMPQAGDYTQD